MPGALAEPSPDPDDERVNEIFAQMTEGLGLGAEIMENMPATPSAFSDLELLDKFEQVKKDLYERKELLNPTTDEGKDLHAEYHALLLEMKKRNLQ